MTRLQEDTQQEVPFRSLRVVSKGNELANKRITRVVVPDFPHRVVQRGARRMDVFFSADDRQEYLGLLSQSALKHSSDFFAWCPMSNHAHFVGDGSRSCNHTLS